MNTLRLTFDRIPLVNFQLYKGVNTFYYFLLKTKIMVHYIIILLSNLYKSYEAIVVHYKQQLIGVYQRVEQQKYYLKMKESIAKSFLVTKLSLTKSVTTRYLINCSPAVPLDFLWPYLQHDVEQYLQESLNFIKKNCVYDQYPPWEVLNITRSELMGLVWLLDCVPTEKCRIWVL